ncbi:MAG: SDR family oxidoreductase [Saccharofermentans sp.]|nr:SDR family oxidoreductase [Saccharofermentans sp.]
MSHIVISGGSRGIGKACALLFRKEGYDVTVLSRSKPEYDLNGIEYIQCDVSDPSSVKDAISKITGPIDVLVSNAGVSLTGLATDFGTDEYRLVMDTNFGGLYNLARNVIPGMVSRKSGVIIAISSMWGQTGASCEALYSASKGAIDSYVKALAKELGPSGIRVNAVSPGVVMTDMMSSYTEEDIDALREETPLERIGTPDDIAKTVYFIASDSSSFITGQIIGVNGGLLI